MIWRFSIRSDGLTSQLHPGLGVLSLAFTRRQMARFARHLYVANSVGRATMVCGSLLQMKLCLAIILIVGSSIPASAVTIDTVTVGDPGNSNDPATGNFFGAVNYSYNMGKYEVTVGQYAAFLNAVAANDKYGLYSVHMATDTRIAGIAKSGTSGNFSYSVIGSPDHPITYVNWADTLRFANWLQNGQPSGVEGPGTTETGAYTLNGVVGGPSLLAVTRNPSATWFIPTENEWYKAAHYDPSTGSYYDYPTSTSTVPNNNPPSSDTGNSANFNIATGNGSYPLTDVCAYTLSPSPYGTFDQGGNVFEWNESVFSPTPPGSPYREILGGSFGYNSSYLKGVVSVNYDPSTESGLIGFRVASLPEPGDFNNNGSVDAADYVVWRDGLGTTYTQADYDTWRAHFGQTAASGSSLASVSQAAVPEPAAIGLSLFALLALVCKRSAGSIACSERASHQSTRLNLVSLAAPLVSCDPCKNLA